MAKFKVLSTQDPNVSFEVEGNSDEEAYYKALHEVGYNLVKVKPPKGAISFVLVDEYYHYLNRGPVAVDGESSECRYDSLEEARKDIPDVAAELEMAESDITIVKETREVVD